MTKDALNFLTNEECDDKVDILSAVEEGAGQVELRLQFYDYEILEEFLEKINQEFVDHF
jgi:hypothetical protein